MNWYCEAAKNHPVHGPYHDQEYGFPLSDTNSLFERLCLEIFQAGLSWLTILKKKENFHCAFDGFDLTTVAAYGDADRMRLLSDPGIIRNRLKVDAIIANANQILTLEKSHGSFAAWIAAHHPRKKGEWVKLFKKNFKFTGGEITGEFLMSIGYLPGTHSPDCPTYRIIAKLSPPWAQIGEPFYEE